MMKNILNISLSIFILIALSSCHDKTKRKLQFMSETDMYDPVPYEPYTLNPVFSNGQTSQAPVKGTIARGQVPYEVPDTNEGYEFAKLNVKSPLDSLQVDLNKGKKLYKIYCSSCHGDKGSGNGILSQRDKFNGIPNFKDREITEGSIYHVIMYGRNMMGSHASQLTNNERWQVVHYVQNLRTNLIK